jgi:microsomal dipeptidase-like Zn-dependent dipeptidase
MFGVRATARQAYRSRKVVLPFVLRFPIRGSYRSMSRGDLAQRFLQVSAQRAAAGIAAPREDPIPYVPELNTPRRMERLAHNLHQRQHPDRVIEKILGANWLRLLSDVAPARG